MAVSPSPVQSAARRYDIDAMRAGALSLLIVFHVASVFSIDRWVVKHLQPGIWADHLMALMSPWRMSLVFFVGGVALRYLMDKVGPGGLIRDRLLRLAPPFLFAIIVLVPPAEYLRQTEYGLFHGSFWSFLSHDAWVAINYHGLLMPAQQHAWFLPYLFAYAVVAGLIAKYLPKALPAAQGILETYFGGWRLVLLVMALFMLVDGMINPFHQRSPLIFTDITGNLHYAPMFALGFVIARSAPIWDWLARNRRALAAAAIVLLIADMTLRFNSNIFAIGRAAMPQGFAAGAYGAVALIAIAAWTHAKANRPMRWLSYFNDAILPVYILHMIFLVVSAHFMRLAGWPVWAALPSLILISGGGPLLLYEFAIRRFAALRFVFGLKRAPHAPPSQPRIADAPLTAEAPSLNVAPH